MQSGNGRYRFQPAAEIITQTSQQHSQAGRVDLAHLAYMTRHMAFRDECRKRVLLHQRAMPVGALLDRGERTLRPGRRNHETQTNSREKALRERPDVEDRLGAIERLQCIERATGKAEFAIVVVLDDDGASGLREFEQSCAAPHGPYGTERELMRRRHADHSRVAWQLFNDHPFIIDRHGYDPRVYGHERGAQRGVTGVLDRDHGTPRGDEDSSKQVEGLL